jgi:nucleoside-diphosphate-sugar epimerase
VGVRDAKSIYSIGNKATRGYAIQTVAATTPGNRFLGRIYPHVRKSERVYRHFHIDEVRSSWADIGKARRLLGTPRTHRLGHGIAESMPWYSGGLMAQFTARLPLVGEETG